MSLQDLNLQDAGQLGTVEDVENLVDMFGSMMTTVLPIIGGCLIIYVAIRINKKLKDKKERAKQQHELNKQIKKQQANARKNNANNPNQQIFNNEQAMMQRLDNTENQYYDRKYDSLALNFDENGKII